MDKGAAVMMPATSTALWVSACARRQQWVALEKAPRFFQESALDRGEPHDGLPEYGEIQR
jgi:hypothetical protein